LLPAVDGAALHYFAWFGPLVVAVGAKMLIDRRWKPKSKHAPAMGAATATNPGTATS
jgi:hypothetical protein